MLINYIYYYICILLLQYMSDIKELISVLAPDEQNEFINYLNNRNKRKDTNNVALFKAFQKGKEDDFKIRLGVNNYNVLHHRLKERLIEFASGNTLTKDVSAELQIIKEVVLARKLFGFEKYKLAFKLLHKAELSAITIQHYSLLSEIYHTLIEYSYLSDSQDQHKLFNKLHKNTEAFINQEKLNTVYAKVRKAYEEVEFKGEALDLQVVLMREYNLLNINEEIGYSFQVLHQMASLADIYGAKFNNYNDVELFFESRLRKLQNSSTDVEKNLKYHIELIYLLANIYFRKKDFSQSSMYLDEMEIQMNRYEQRYYYNYYPKLVMLRALNLNFTGRANLAIQLLESINLDTRYSLVDVLQIDLSRIMILLQQDRVEETKKLIAKFHRTDSWYEKNAGINWVLNKNFLEILIHLELGNIDLAESRINSFERKFNSKFRKGKKSREMQFLRLVKLYYNDISNFNTQSLEQFVNEHIGYKEHEQEDLFFMSYYAWLRAKIEGQPVYLTTMNLLSQNTID